MIQPDTGAELIISSHLIEGENLLWCGRPRPGLRLTPSDRIMIPFSFLWAGFSFFWEYSVFRMPNSLFFRIWGIPFVAVGLYMLIGRFFFDAYRRSRTYYGFSNRRAIIVSRVWNGTVKSVYSSEVEQVEIEQLSAGLSSIYFGPRPPVLGGRRNRLPDPPTFEMIENARDVYDLIVKTQASRR